MKNLKDYLNEGLISRKVSIKTPIKYSPETKKELKHIILDLLNKGITNLNCIDVSGITDMDSLFYEINEKIKVKEIDISEWNVSKVTNMHFLFAKCKEFKSDLSSWNVSNVENMESTFYGCKNFTSDLSNWNVSNVKYMDNMFAGSMEFNSDLSNWDVSGCNWFRSINSSIL